MSYVANVYSPAFRGLAGPAGLLPGGCVVRRPLGGLWDDVVNALNPVVTDTVDQVTNVGKEQSSKLVQDFINSTEFKVVLQKVRAEAEAGVVDQVKKNAPQLLMFTLAGGAIGGTLFKGTIGVLLAGGLAAYAGYSLVTAAAAQKAPPKKKAR